MSYTVMIGFYASAFGLFGATFFGDSTVVRHVLMTAAVFVLAGLNFFGPDLVVRVENVINFAKVALLGLFVVAGLMVGDVDYEMFAVSEWVPPVALVAGAMVIFLNYEGFELIANVAPEVAATDRPRVLPRAFYYSVGFTIVLYVLISIVTVGMLNRPELVNANEFAVAVAAETMFGRTGFVVIAVAAMLSTASAINATLFSSARMTSAIAAEGELPHQLATLVRQQPLAALLLVCGTGAILVAIEVIAALGSGGFLLMFTAVNFASFRLVRTIGVVRAIPVIGASVCILAVVVMFSQIGSFELKLFGGMLALAVAIQFATRLTGRPLTMRMPAEPRNA